MGSAVLIALNSANAELKSILQIKSSKSVELIRGHINEDTIRTWVHAFNEAGCSGLERAPIPGRPA
jgi:hypothetical protein